MLKNIIKHQTNFNKNQYGIYVPDLFAPYGFLLLQQHYEELSGFLLILCENFAADSIVWLIATRFIFFLRLDWVLKHHVVVENLKQA